MEHTILVPLDGSPFAEYALGPALWIARHTGAALHLIRVHRVPLVAVDGPAPLYEAPLDASLRNQEREYLERVRAQLPEVAPVPITTELADEAVANSICAAAVARHALLIVMTTHGRGPVSRFWLGSVADQLLRCSPVPVLLIRPGEGPPDFTRGLTSSKILVPLDGSALAEQILEPATQLGDLLGAAYTLFNVISPAFTVGYEAAADPMGHVAERMMHEMRETQRKLRTEAEAYLEQVAGRLRKQGRIVHTRVAESERPAGAILDAARDLAADLIAAATHGRGGLARLVVGSIADKIVRGAAAPVLVYHPRTLTEDSHERHAHQRHEEQEAPHHASGDSGGCDDAEPRLDPGCCHGQGCSAFSERSRV
jgi:nucleotide-binding universal stress UspA family protein